MMTPSSTLSAWEEPELPQIPAEVKEKMVFGVLPPSSRVAKAKSSKGTGRHHRMNGSGGGRSRKSTPDSPCPPSDTQTESSWQSRLRTQDVTGSVSDVRPKLLLEKAAPKSEADNRPIEPSDAMSVSDLSSPLSSVGSPDTPPGTSMSVESTPVKRKLKILLTPIKKKVNSIGYLPDQREHEVTESNDYCAVCGRTGNMLLCCESCPKTFHLICCEPPLEEVPEGEYHCKECRYKMNPSIPYAKSLFSALLNDLNSRNPVEYKLPKKIQERFEGVSGNAYNEYQDQNMKDMKWFHGFAKEEEQKTVGKHGEILRCYHCRQSGETGVPLATCDYCNLSWHMDCLDPPLSHIKMIGTKWMCPNHANQAAKLPRRVRRPKMVEPYQQRGYKNNGDIEVLLSEDEDTLVREIPSFDVTDTPDGVSAKYPKHLAKTLQIEGVVYRLPAKTIKLDFIDAVWQSNNNPPLYQNNYCSETLLALNELATRPFAEKEGVRNLEYLAASDTKEEAIATTKYNLDKLLDAALDSDETEELEAIRRLMRIKGKEALMKFLQE